KVGCRVFLAVGLEDVQRAWAAAAGHRVDEDQRVPFLKQVVGQVHASDAVVDDADTRIVLCDLGISDYFRAESVVTQEDVADPGYQDGGCRGAAGAGYIRFSWRWRRASGSDTSPSTAATASTKAMMAMNIQPKTSMWNSFRGFGLLLQARLRRGR